LKNFVLLNFFAKDANGQFISQRESRDDSTSYYITYSFSVDGKNFTKESQVKEETYMRLSQSKYKNDEPLTVKYYSSNPEISAIDKPSIFFVLFLLLFSLIWNGFVYGIIFFVFYKKRKIDNLSKYGKIIDGKLISCKGYLGENDFYIKGTYNFSSPVTRQLVQGEFNNITRNDLKPEKIGFMKSIKGDLNENMPEPDTPVKILYVDDKTFEIL